MHVGGKDVPLHKEFLRWVEFKCLILGRNCTLRRMRHRLLWCLRQAVSGSGERILIGAASSNVWSINHNPIHVVFFNVVLTCCRTNWRPCCVVMPLIVWNLWPALRFDQMSCSWPQRTDPWGARWQRQMAFENWVYKMLTQVHRFVSTSVTGVWIFLVLPQILEVLWPNLF